MKEGAVECKGCGNVYPVSQEKCEYCGRINPTRIVGNPNEAAAADASTAKGGFEDSLSQIKTSFDNARKTILKEGNDILQSVNQSIQQAVSPSPPPVPLDEIYPRPPAEPVRKPKEHVSIFICILSFFIPFFGLIYFLTKRKKKNTTAWIALALSIINFISLSVNSFA